MHVSSGGNRSMGQRPPRYTTVVYGLSFARSRVLFVFRKVAQTPFHVLLIRCRGQRKRLSQTHVGGRISCDPAFSHGRPRPV